MDSRSEKVKRKWIAGEQSVGKGNTNLSVQIDPQGLNFTADASVLFVIRLSYSRHSGRTEYADVENLSMMYGCVVLAH